MEENTDLENQEAVDQVYNYAAEQMITHGKDKETVKLELEKQGVDRNNAATIVDSLEQEIGCAKKERANKDMLYGALWLIGGTVATVSDIGAIFWGAIVFGGFQFLKGAYNAYS